MKVVKVFWGDTVSNWVAQLQLKDATRCEKYWQLEAAGSGKKRKHNLINFNTIGKWPCDANGKIGNWTGKWFSDFAALDLWMLGWRRMVEQVKDIIWKVKRKDSFEGECYGFEGCERITSKNMPNRVKTLKNHLNCKSPSKQRGLWGSENSEES